MWNATLNKTWHKFGLLNWNAEVSDLNIPTMHVDYWEWNTSQFRQVYNYSVCQTLVIRTHATCNEKQPKQFQIVGCKGKYEGNDVKSIENVKGGLIYASCGERCEWVGSSSSSSKKGWGVTCVCVCGARGRRLTPNHTKQNKNTISGNKTVMTVERRSP